jgi:hypothetical protein
MTKGNWIKMGALAATLCTGLGAAHAQSRSLRHQAPTAPTAGAHAERQPRAEAVVFSYFTGLAKAVFQRAMDEQITVSVAPKVDERFFDI